MGGQTMEVEVAGLRLGDQIAAEYTPINGLSFDPKADAFVVDTETLDHLIYHPEAIWADDSAEGLHSVQVTDADGNRHIIKLRTPLPLPPR
jgi:hypothetical protein